MPHSPRARGRKDDPDMLSWLTFLACSAAIFISGYRLSHNGDIIAEKTGMGRSWVGIVLIASVTSLPELLSGISAVAYTNAPDLATGGVLGSCAFNLAILVVMDAQLRGKPLSARVGQDNLMAAGMSITLIGTSAMGLYMSPSGWSFMGVGFYTPIIIVLYLAAMKMIFTHNLRESKDDSTQEDLQYEHHSLRKSIIGFSMDSIIVIIAAIYLPVAGQAIATQTGLGETFIGNALIALSTSLPELVVSLSAIRIGAVDMSVGNILGSNMFNLLVLAVDDIFYRKGSLLNHSDSTQMLPALFSIAMTAIFITGISYRGERKRLLPVGWDTLAIALMFIANLWLLLSLRN